MADDPIPGEGRQGSIEIAGWEDSAGEWQNVEQGDPAPSADDAARSSRVVVRWSDSDGEAHYRTTSHITEDYTIADWLKDNYGVQFV